MSKSNGPLQLKKKREVCSNLVNLNVTCLFFKRKSDKILNFYL